MDTGARWPPGNPSSIPAVEPAIVGKLLCFGFLICTVWRRMIIVPISQDCVSKHTYKGMDSASESACCKQVPSRCLVLDTQCRDREQTAPDPPWCLQGVV